MPLDTGGVTSLDLRNSGDRETNRASGLTPSLEVGPDIGAALKAAREASGRWCGGRLAVERIAGELRLTLGESSVMMPDEPDTGSRVPHVRPVDGVAEVCRAPSRQGGAFGARVRTARAAAEGTPL